MVRVAIGFALRHTVNARVAFLQLGVFALGMRLIMTNLYFLRGDGGDGNDGRFVGTLGGDRGGVLGTHFAHFLSARCASSAVSLNSKPTWFLASPP